MNDFPEEIWQCLNFHMMFFLSMTDEHSWLKLSLQVRPSSPGRSFEDFNYFVMDGEILIETMYSFDSYKESEGTIVF